MKIPEYYVGTTIDEDTAALFFPVEKALLDAAVNASGDAYIEGVGARVMFGRTAAGTSTSYVMYQMRRLSRDWGFYFVSNGFTL